MYMSKIITSFDIGIRNLAYCIMEYRPQNISGNQFIIHDWNVIDLLKNDQIDAKNKKCQIKYKSGGKLGQCCDHPAHYYAMTKGVPTNLCKIHAKSYDSTQISRLYTVANLTLYELARLAVNQLNKIDFSLSEEIIFESQPSKNPKMKNFSMLLFNYFIIHYIAEKPELEQRLKDVKFVSSRGKLTVYDGPYIQCHLKNQHARNKFYGKVYCRYLIRYNLERLHFLDGYKKSDDLCDSLLQGAWYLMNGCTGTNTPKPHPKILLKLKDPSRPQQLSLPPQQPKIVLKLKQGPIGQKMLRTIKDNQSTAQIRIDYQINKYRQLKRGSKPRPNCHKYTLSNIKYLIDHHQSNQQLISSMDYYFGQSKDLIINM